MYYYFAHAGPVAVKALFGLPLLEGPSGIQRAALRIAVPFLVMGTQENFPPLSRKSCMKLLLKIR